MTDPLQFSAPVFLVPETIRVTGILISHPELYCELAFEHSQTQPYLQVSRLSSVQPGLTPISLPKPIPSPLRKKTKNGRSRRQPPTTSRSQQRQHHQPNDPRTHNPPNLQPQMLRPHPRHRHPTPLPPPHLHHRLHALIQTKAEEEPIDGTFGDGNRNEEAGARERDVERRGELWRRFPRRYGSGGRCGGGGGYEGKGEAFDAWELGFEDAWVVADVVFL